jgi:cellobiose phosphorylase
MGTHPKNSAGRLEVGFDQSLRAILVRNPYLLVHSDRIGFLACDRRPDAVTVNREAFLGTAGPLDSVPIGLRYSDFAAREVPNRQACGVLRRLMTLAPGESSEVNFYLGGGRDATDIAAILRSLSTFATARGGGTDPIEDERQRWERYLGRVRVRTPEDRLDPLVNGWLPYQSIVSRLRGRTGFYQSGGAFGFRDQLQDVYALLPLDPQLAEDHLVEAARRQFREGDVLHWWHPDTNRGVRTRCSDDLLWLPWVLAQTIRWTGDRSLLDRTAPYLDAPELEEGEDEKYDVFPSAQEEGTLLEHAIRAIDRASSLISERGLPLIGTGDWNDGMDRVGREGMGESIWLGWFFIDTCRLFAPIVREAGLESEARVMEERSARVKNAIEEFGWDGAWYRRAFFDDGSPLGSTASAEAKIDSIAQSWGVISGAADPERARLALDAAWERLVRRDAGIALLLTPPFTGEGPDPGYIAAYAPGVRENGGQYTHATAWLLRAFALAGQGDRAGELLRLLLPTRHAGGDGANRYRVEPYVAVADIYGVAPHIGRGGWSWYTGSAGWIWRVVIEDILGVRREGPALRVAPCIPADWDGYEVEVEIDGIRVEICVKNPDRVSCGVKSCTINGAEIDPARIPLSGATHLRVDVVLGK